MKKERHTPQHTPSHNFSYALQAQALQLADVKVFAKHYEPSRRMRLAAQSLIELGLDGHEIEEARGSGEYFPKDTRQEAALHVYRRYFGPPHNKSRRK